MAKWIQGEQSLLPTAEPTRDDLLYFAGFYDGEGSVCAAKNGGCIVQVPQKDPEPLFRGRSLWGGSIRQPAGRDIWVWVMSGDRARLFLQAIYPFVTQRRKVQIDQGGAFKLSGRKSLLKAGITPQRREVRSKMTETQRHSDSCNIWYRNNREKAKATAVKWAKDNRELLNERQRQRRALARKSNSESSTAYVQ